MEGHPSKILIVRLSSIGDIVLTTPIIRSLRNCYPEASIHFLTKAAYSDLLQYHPDLDRVHLFRGDLRETLQQLEEEQFDFVLDLHRNIRSALIKTYLDVPSATYPKDRWPVLLHTRFKWPALPKRHTVDRYASTLESLSCELDGGGADLFLPDSAWEAAQAVHKQHFPSRPPVAVVLGGKFATKKWPTRHFVHLLNRLKEPVLLLGGPDEKEEAQEIASQLEVPFLNAAGQFKIGLSAALLKSCKYTIAHDTGFMHIAAALGQTVFSLWGSTVPELGFSPYQSRGLLLQVKDLGCRPCSKLGYQECPKGHFRCMNDLKPEWVHQQITSFIRKHGLTGPTKLFT